MKILITGGTGFIGSRLAISFLNEGHKVFVLGQTNTPAEEYNKKLIEDAGALIHLTSVNEREKLFNLLKDIDLVFHLAAAQHEMNISDEKFWKVNVEGTRNMLDAAVANKVKRFIHGSTIGVYGVLDGRIDENSRCKPDNIYGITKLEGEKLVLSYKEKIPVVVIRIPETYGPGDRRLLKMFKAINKNAFPIIGKGKNLHHLIYIDDLVEGFKLAACNEDASGKIFLFAGKNAVTTNEMVSTIAKHLNKKPPKIKIPLPLIWVGATIIENIFRPLKIQPPIHRRRVDFFKKSFTLSSENAFNTFGFAPKTSFYEGALETAKWYKNMNLL